MTTTSLAGDEPEPHTSGIREIRHLLRQGLGFLAVDVRRDLDTALQVLDGITASVRDGAAIVARALGDLLDPSPSRVADRASEGEAPASDGTTTGAGHQD